jgi:hypothetical protein
MKTEPDEVSTQSADRRFRPLLGDTSSYYVMTLDNFYSNNNITTTELR